MSTRPDPPENCQLNVKKLPKNLTFFSTKLSFFIEKCQVLGNFKKNSIGNFPEGQMYTSWMTSHIPEQLIES